MKRIPRGILTSNASAMHLGHTRGRITQPDLMLAALQTTRKFRASGLLLAQTGLGK